MKRILSTLAQKWPEYFLEIIAITLGIWAAYVLDDWKEQHENQELEQTYLKAIQAEFTENLDQFQEVVATNRTSLKSCEGLLRQFTQQEPDPDSIHLHWESAWLTSSFDPSQSSIQSVLSSSNLKVIQNEELRQLIVGWTDGFKDYQEEEIEAKNHFLNNLLPYMTANFNFEEILNGKPPLQVETTFKNMITIRIIFLRFILESEDQRLQEVEAAMHRIIELTAINP